MALDETAFRAYDIRGIYPSSLNEEAVEKAANAFRHFAKGKVLVAADPRVSSPSLKKAFISGATKAGLDVVDLGMVPRGVLMYYGWRHKIASGYISASHLPPEWNGLKVTLPDGLSFSEADSQRLKQLVFSGDFHTASSPGKVSQLDALPEYLDYVASKIPKPGKRLKILLDIGNGSSGKTAKMLFEKSGFQVETVFEEPDGRFPNRESELSVKSLEKSISLANKFDVVVAFDGDADRIALIDNKGRFVEPETVANLIMSDLLEKEKGDIIANVECSKIIELMAEKFNRKIHRVPVGYAYIVQALLEKGACFGVEKSMHFFIRHILPFDDGLVAGLYSAYALSNMDKPLSDFVDETPKYISKTFNFEFPDDRKKFESIKSIEAGILEEFPKANTLDGVRVDFDNSWALVRKSKTSPLIRVTVEARDMEEFNRLKGKFTGMVEKELERWA